MVHIHKFSFICLFLACVFSSRAQSVFYGFSKTTAAYNHLQSPTVLTTTMSANYEVMPMPAGFKTFNVALPSTLKVGGNGWIVCTAPTRSFAFNPFLAALHASPATSIGYKLEAAAQDSVLKIEWRDVSPDDALPGETTSFQLWLYKKSQAVEFHYGPSTVSATVKPAIQVALLSPDFLQDYEIHSLFGNSSTVKDSLSGDTAILHIGVPPAGTVYRFTNPSTSIDASIHPLKVAVYPNPTSDFIRIDVDRQVEYSLTNTAGVCVVAGTYIPDRQIDVSKLPSGIYLLRATAGIERYTGVIHINK